MGEETYYINIICKVIENNVLSEEEKILNKVILYGSETSIIHVIDQSKRYPMIGGKYLLIILKEAQFLSKKIEKLYDYITHPLSSTILVICYNSKTIDKRKKLYKILILKKNVILFNSKKITEDKIPIWIAFKVKKLTKSIELEASYLLIEYLGTSLLKLNNELNKMVLNITNNSKITSYFIKNNISLNKNFNYVDWKIAIAKLELKKVQDITLFFLENPKNSPINIIRSILCNFFIKIIQHHTSFLSLDNKKKYDLIEESGISPFFLNNYASALQNLTIKKCIQILFYFKKADKQTKYIDNPFISEKTIFIELLFKIFDTK